MVDEGLVEEVKKLMQQGMRAAMEWMVMNEVKDLYNTILSSHGLAPIEGSLFDVSYRSPDVVFQSGVPGVALRGSEVLEQEVGFGKIAIETATRRQLLAGEQVRERVLYQFRGLRIEAGLLHGLQRGMPIVLILYWRGRQVMERDYTMFCISSHSTEKLWRAKLFARHIKSAD